MDLVRREEHSEMTQLFSVGTDFEIPPEWSPSGLGSPGLLGTSLDKVADGLETVGPQMGPVRVGAVNGIAKDGDQSRLGDYLVNSSVGLEVCQVERSALSAQGPRGGSVEQPLVVVAPPDPLAVAMRVTRPALPRRWAVTQEKLRLLDRREVQLGMTG